MAVRGSSLESAVGGITSGCRGRLGGRQGNSRLGGDDDRGVALTGLAATHHQVGGDRGAQHLAALGLKEYFEGAWGPTTADKPHATASLGHSEVARIKHPPRHAVPEFNQRVEDRLEVRALVAGEQSGEVLQQKTAWM